MSNDGKVSRVARRAGTTLIASALCVMATSSSGQWHGYPTPDIPRTPDGRPDLSAPTPRAPDGTPDLSGIWLADSAVFDLRNALAEGEEIPFRPWSRDLYEERLANNQKEDPGAHCLPTGLPVRALLATPMKFVQIRGLTLILYETRTMFRQIFTDGRPLPEVDWPSWQGYSIGHWEDETFVIETMGTNGRAWLDQPGLPATEALRMTERFTRTDFGHMRMEFVIDDPMAYTRPWTIVGNFTLQADTELLEFICEENNIAAEHIVQ
jgi:hypothetical protein